MQMAAIAGEGDEIDHYDGLYPKPLPAVAALKSVARMLGFGGRA
jgi:hypothetical protein